MPVHTYDTCGFYPVRLIVEDANTCRDTTTRTAEVWCPPVAAFGADTICLGQPTTFVPTAAPGSDPIVSWTWYTGDGAVISQTSAAPITHTYLRCGLFTVSLVVGDANGCRDSVSGTVFVRCLPVADFSAAPVCLNDTMYFNDLSVSSNGAIVGWQWNFGDNTSSTLATPAHLYASTGIFTVSLAVTDSAGCVGSTSEDVEVYPLPVVDVVDTLVVLCGQSIPDTLSRYLISSSDSGVWSGPAVVASLWTTPSDSALGAFDPSLLALNTQHTFVFTATNAFGYQSSNTLTISIVDAETADARPDTTLCFGSGTYNLALLATPGGGD
ncbi:MAG: hypothetical protein OHK0039_18130 [Bacteroidia bacterium]